MRKNLIYFLLMATMCITSCASGTTSENENNPETSFSIVESTDEVEEQPIIPTISENVKKPENGIYVFCQNNDLYYYPFVMQQQGINIWIISEEKLSDEIVVNVDTELKYTVYQEVIDLVGNLAYSIGEQGFPYGLYQAYRGMDWKALRELSNEDIRLHKEYLEVQALFDAEKATKEELDAVFEKWNPINKQYNKILRADFEDWKTFLKTAPSDTLDFYCYSVGVVFESNENLKEPQVVTEIQLQAGDWSTTVEIGKLQMSCGEWTSSFNMETGILERSNEKQYYQWSGALESKIAVGMVTGGKIGKGFCNDLLNCVTSDTIAIKDIYVYDSPETMIEKARIDIDTDGGRQSVEWKEGREILIREGEKFSVDVIVSDPHMLEENYKGNRVMVVEYELDGEIYIATGDLIINGKWLVNDNPRFVYAEQFHGIDIRSYYEYYAYQWNDTEEAMQKEWETNVIRYVD